MGSIPVGGLGKFFFRVIRLENAFSLFSLYPSRHSIYHLMMMIMTMMMMFSMLDILTYFKANVKTFPKGYTTQLKS